MLRNEYSERGLVKNLPPFFTLPAFLTIFVQIYLNYSS